MSTGMQLKNDLKSPWLRGILLVVGTTVAVNAGYIFYAFHSPPNLVVDNFYERGKQYFHTEHERAQQASWRLQILPPETPTVGREQTYRLYVIDETGQPVTSGQVTLLAFRPNDERSDFRRPLTYVEKGTFVGTVRFPLPGNWDLIAQVETDGATFDVAQRIFVQR